MRCVKTRSGVVLHYSASPGRGAAVPVVLINSLGTDFRMWEAFVRCLGDTHPTIQYDQRGHGLSSCPRGPYSITDLGDDLADLLDHLGVRGAVVIGLSVGGMVAQSLRRHRPELVRGLVLCDTAAKIGDAVKWEERIADLAAGGLATIVEPILGLWFSKDYRTRLPSELAVWRAMLERTPLAGYLATCTALRDADLRRDAAAIDVPTLCVCGSEDGATPPALVQAFCQTIPGARYCEIAGAGHLPPIEAPEILATLVSNFIAENKFV